MIDLIDLIYPEIREGSSETAGGLGLRESKVIDISTYAEGASVGCQ